MTALRDDVGWGIPPVISHSGFAGRCGALSGRMACLLAVALLVCVSVAQGQAIEEGGFPVKGGGVSGESFSLFCPARLVVEAGESVLLSCSATDVPEEGVRYDWVSISGDGFYLLSASDELSPLFTAPLSGAGEEYAYRLTAMAAGEYRTASLTVSVEGVPGETIGAPVVREECDPFTVPEGLGAGCVEDKGPAPFGFGSVAEFPFPEAPGLPDRPSGPDRSGGSVMQAPPRLECPVAIFLEEIETGSIECRAWDASGEEHLDYSWEPVGGTTRDYLENPRLIPEDSPTPSVVAPEAPAYETLESFRSVETTFRYRYRLTAMSRATGLSSSSEVEVFVSSSRPSVYCPLEVAVEEGATIALDCEGVDPLSSRMDYDEEEASVLWEWEGLWGASTALLDATDRSSPLFTAPPNSAGEAYHYIASMTSSSSGRPSTARRRVTVTVVGEEEGTRASSDASAPAYKAGAPVITCNDAEIYEATEDFTLDCSVTDEPSGATYRWTGPDIENRLTGTDSLTPTFSPPDNVYWDTEYEYNVTMTVAGSDTASAVVVVTVLEKPNIRSCIRHRAYSVEEGAADLVFIGCLDPPQGAPGDDPVYRYMWVNSGITPSSALSLLSRTDISNPVFGVPDDVQQDTIYEYSLIISADNADEYTTQYTVTVLDLDRGAFNLACASSTFWVYQGSEDIELECEAPGAPEGATWEWTARGTTTDTDRLSATDIPNPVFDVHDYSVPIGTGLYFYYTVSVSAGSQREEEDLVVRVIRNSIFIITCEAQAFFFEGDNDRTIGNCFVTRANDRTTPVSFEWEWLSRGTTADTDRLSATDIPNPVFDVPDSIDKHETYEYTLQITWDTSRGSGRGSYFVSVTVLDRDAFDGALALVCTDPDPVYEGSEDIALDCAASGAPDGAEYSYVWEPRGDTPHTARLIAGTDGPTPTFAVPRDVERDRAYTYRVTVTAGNSIPASADVTVTVLNRGSLAVACTDPDPVYEGSEDITLDCAASGAPDGAEYSYVWEPRGDTPHTARLIAGTDGPTPTFAVPRDVERDRAYTYRVTVTAGNSIPASANVTVTVLNRGTLAVACMDPDPVYEGSEDITLDCAASGAPDGAEYSYVWEPRGDTPHTARLIAGTDGPTPTFAVPRDVERDRAYTYRVTVTAGNSIPASANVTVTVLNRGTLAVACTDPGPVYEGSEDITLDCAASGASEGSAYAYAWTARGSTATTDLLVTGADGPTPTFAVPSEVSGDATYEYLLTVSVENAESASANVTVTVLNRGTLAVACTDPGPVYEGSEDITLDCSASGAPEGSVYAYAWTARGSTANTDLLTDKTLLTPAFLVPDDLDETTTYEYLLTASAENAEDATAEVSVTVLDRVEGPPSDPVSRPLASSSAPEPAEPSALGVTVSASPLRFGVQLAETEVSLDPMTDRISTQVSGPYHAGRMTLSPGSGEALDENGEMALSIELASPVTLRHEGVEGASIVLSPSWSYAESCEQLSSQAIGSLYTEVTLTEGACRLLHFGGELNLVDVPSGYYAGSLDLVLRSGQKEETHSVQLDVMVVPAQRVITIGPGGVRFSTSREFAAGLTEEQNLSIYPDVAFLTGEKPHGVFELSNPSLVPLEVSVSARYGYTEATEDGREVVVEDTRGSRLGDLSSLVDIHPSVLVLMPGEKGFVRYGVQAEAFASMGEKGYAAFFDVVSEPRQYVRSDRMPEAVTGERTARVTMRVPGVYVPREGASQLRATLLSLSSFPSSMSATFLLETADVPFAGEVLAYDGEGRELGRRETLVYTRSRVRLPLDRMPEEGTVFLRFAPRGGLQAPEPVSVPWDAPRRDIGAVQNEYQALPSAENSPTANAR